jgi:hypothetical protein
VEHDRSISPALTNGAQPPVGQPPCASTQEANPSAFAQVTGRGLEDLARQANRIEGVVDGFLIALAGSILSRSTGRSFTNSGDRSTRSCAMDDQLDEDVKRQLNRIGIFSSDHHVQPPLSGLNNHMELGIDARCARAAALTPPKLRRRRLIRRHQPPNTWRQSSFPPCIRKENLVSRSVAVGAVIGTMESIFYRYSCSRPLDDIDSYVE